MDQLVTWWTRLKREAEIISSFVCENWKSLNKMFIFSHHNKRVYKNTKMQDSCFYFSETQKVFSNTFRVFWLKIDDPNCKLYKLVYSRTYIQTFIGGGCDVSLLCSPTAELLLLLPKGCWGRGVVKKGCSCLMLLVVGRVSGSLWNTSSVLCECNKLDMLGGLF